MLYGIVELLPSYGQGYVTSVCAFAFSAGILWDTERERDNWIIPQMKIRIERPKSALHVVDCCFIILWWLRWVREMVVDELGSHHCITIC